MSPLSDLSIGSNDFSLVQFKSLSMSSSSYSTSMYLYDVFLSFRVEDTGRTFVSHLHRSLVEKGIQIPDPSEIHLFAIGRWEIALLVISENYASSRWCLEELTEILECYREGSLTLFPVYYGIEPSDVMVHPQEFATRTPDRLQRWSEALTELGSIAGEHSNNWKDQAELVQKITDDIWDKLSVSRLNGLVGMHFHMERMYELLSLECKLEQVREIGICGSVGIVYQQISPYFNTLFSLETVGKIYQDHGSSRLQEELLWEYIQRSSQNVSDVTKARLRNGKVLLIVDGVDNIEQMENVQKVATWFGAGSRVIVTTRDEGLLVDNGVRHAYEVKCLKIHEALQLFYQFAFKQQTPSIRFKQLSVRAVQFAGRIPLALEVLASFLRGKTENDWESVLQILEKQQDKDIVVMRELVVRRKKITKNQKIMVMLMTQLGLSSHSVKRHHCGFLLPLSWLLCGYFS